MFEDILKKFMNQLKRETLINAFLKSIIIFLSISAVILSINLFLNFFNNIIIISLSFVLCFVFTIIVYFVKKPNEYILSKRLDMNGLKDRILTMNELKDDKSFIAIKQREDAISHLKKLDNTNIMCIKGKIIKLSSVISVIFLLISTISIIGINQHLSNGDTYNPYVEVYYKADTGGVVLGDLSQYIHIGNSATEVFAVANDGYVFDKWSDGTFDPYRKDENILDKQVLVAYFVKIDDSIDVPTDSDILDYDEDGNPNTGSGGSGASGSYNDEADNVIDGNINYKDLYDQYYSEALEIINSGGTVPDYLKDLIDYYYKIIG